jgi:osmotically-inducible protein OsmY
MASTLRYLEGKNMSKARQYPSAGQLVARALLCGVTALSLQGCFGFVAAGAVMGTLAATDRRTLGAQTEDKAIAVKAETRIPQIVGDAGHVNVTSFNRKVLLTGEVRDESMKATVEREVLGIQNVESVVNELAIAGPQLHLAFERHFHHR